MRKIDSLQFKLLNRRAVSSPLAALFLFGLNSLFKNATVPVKAKSRTPAGGDLDCGAGSASYNGGSTKNPASEKSCVLYNYL